MVRYIPRYKVLSKFKQAIWLDKRRKIGKFNRKKWENKKRVYFPRRLKKFEQDRGACYVSDNFAGDRVIRLRKVYRYLLRDKQCLQLYYGVKRLRFLQLKLLALSARRISSRKSISSSRIFLYLLENRLEIVFLRMGFVASLMQSRRLLSTFCVKVDSRFVESFGFQLGCGSFMKLEPLKSVDLLARFLKNSVPFFYFRSREECRIILCEKKRFFVQPCFVREIHPFFSFIKKVSLSKRLKKNLKK